MWQELIVAVCVVLATIAVVRRMLPGRRSSCSSGCSGCSAQSACSTVSRRDANIEVHTIEVQPSRGA
ncbi:FeoB-associated Cys-rich membrane protein [Gilvimarinus polysaccharolyticus]|uniref:FeoB-associated Cys-rich membrane protein n=1 Tax=Gilvimarinus polysaccharolyticus TaxID=863921 RepID=UPI0006737FC5|nr:FeoB-associated Cys-rich membrane protein [Gilvimarinus polysaccharolyticus]